MAYYPATSFVPQFFTDAGVPLSGGSITAYVAGTTTPTNMFIDDAGTSAGSVITLNARGEPLVSGNTVVIWLDSEVAYKFVLKDASGVSKWTIDDIATPGGDLSGEDGSSLIGFIQAGSGAVARTAQSKMRDSVHIDDFGAVADAFTDNLAIFNNAAALEQLVEVDEGFYSLSAPPDGFFWSRSVTPPTFNDSKPKRFGFYQGPTGQFFAQNGAQITRLADRVFVGDAIVNDGAFPNVDKDWLSALAVTGVTGATLAAAQFACLNNADPAAGGAGVFASQSLHFGAASTSAIGLSAYAVNNNTTLATASWGLYVEAHRENSTVSGTYGIEIDTKTKVAEGNVHPYQQGIVNALQIASGAEMSAVGQFDAATAINIQSNPMKFMVGINFGATSLTGSDGVTGNGTAIAMAKGHRVVWYNAGGAITSAITGGVVTTNLATSLNFSDSGASIFDSSGAPIFQVGSTATATANFFYMEGSASGAGTVNMNAAGSDSNIDVRLTPKGTGNVRFGTYTASVLTQDGYISIKDAGGTVRRLLVG